MKKFFKAIVFGTLGVIALGVGIGAMSGGTSNNTTVAAKVVHEATKKNDITLAKFNKLQNGMTYEEVVNILGVKGDLTTESGSGNYIIKMYSWVVDGTGSNMNCTFENGKLSAKGQIGLQ